ncbi:MAG TPA: hypothetical protein VKU77_28670 [Streptosporangiaceae bacterium]|nr:hypothetical protein [Streptosporangiaceae bacterium]
MRELREADGNGRPENDVPRAEAVRERAEARSPAEVRSPAETRSRGEYAAEVRSGLSLEAVGRFEPRRAGLPEMHTGDAAAYLDARLAARPWLAAARDRPPAVQRLFAALDQGGGHAHIRHEGWVTEEMNRRRVAYLEDPAQLDPAKRAAGIDGLLPGDRRHKCGSIATRIADPDVFAVAIARGSEHPDVRAALQAEFDKRVPAPVVLPIAGLLGPNGHRHCTGWHLEAVEGSVKTAAERRDAAADVKARPVETFDGGTITFRFGPNRGRSGYEIVTMYVDPPDGG